MASVTEAAKYEEALHRQREQRKKTRPKSQLVKVELFQDIVVEHKPDTSVILYKKECLLQPTINSQHIALRGRLALVKDCMAPYSYQR